VNIYTIDNDDKFRDRCVCVYVCVCVSVCEGLCEIQTETQIHKGRNLRSNMNTQHGDDRDRRIYMEGYIVWMRIRVGQGEWIWGL
jgi:hypothetical protein